MKNTKYEIGVDDTSLTFYINDYAGLITFIEIGEGAPGTPLFPGKTGKGDIEVISSGDVDKHVETEVIDFVRFQYIVLTRGMGHALSTTRLFRGIISLAGYYGTVGDIWSVSPSLVSDRPEVVETIKAEEILGGTSLNRALLDKVHETYVQKNAAYGDSFGRSVEKYGLISALTRMSDKFNRMEQLILNPETDMGDESLKDTLLDLAGYCVMTLMELEK